MKLSRTLLSLSIALIVTASPIYAASTTLTAGERASLASIAAIDKGEILLSIVASNKKPSSGVADFAKMMIDQHGSNLTQILEMANNLHAFPLIGGNAEKLKEQGAKEMMALSGLQGEQFDKAYVDAMVKGHQGALDLISQHLMKTAKHEEIKKFLTDTQTVVEHHLEDAKKLQAEMKS